MFVRFVNCLVKWFTLVVEACAVVFVWLFVLALVVWLDYFVGFSYCLSFMLVCCCFIFKIG